MKLNDEFAAKGTIIASGRKMWLELTPMTNISGGITMGGLMVSNGYDAIFLRRY
jgi:hypothetical protein